MKTVIEMAIEAGLPFDSEEHPEIWMPYMNVGREEIERFAELVRADERSECAKVCEQESKELGGVAAGPFVTDFGKHTHMSMAAGAENCAAAIRARSNT
jgi:hypothetical protein